MEVVSVVQSREGVGYVLFEGLEAFCGVIGAVFGVGWETGVVFGVGIGLCSAYLLVFFSVFFLAFAAAVWYCLAFSTSHKCTFLGFSLGFVAFGTVGRHVARGAGLFGFEWVWDG